VKFAEQRRQPACGDGDPQYRVLQCCALRAQKYGLDPDIEPDANGLVYAPTGPGLGAEIDFELIRRKSLGVLA
jgi:hypothetical protein